MEFTSYIGSQYQLILDVNTVSQSVANNSSVISYVLKVKKLEGYGYYTSVGQKYEVIINGSTVRSGTWTYDFNNYTEKTITSGQTTIYHNSDGNKSIGVYAKTSMYSIGSGTISGTYTLNRILRGIQNLVFNSGWSSIDGSKTLTFEKLSSSARVEVVYDYYSLKDKAWKNVRTVSTNYTSGTSFTFQSDFINLSHQNNPNSQTVDIRVIARAYQGDTLANTITRTTKLSLKKETPSVSGTVKVNGTNQSLLGTNRAVQNIHWLRVDVSATAKNYASIDRYEFTFEGRKITGKNAYAEFKIFNSGSNEVKVTVYDSRGFNYTSTLATINTQAYRPPEVKNLEIYRMENGAINPIGAEARVTGTVDIVNITNSSGSDINSVTWKISFDGNNYLSKNISATKTVPIEETLDFTLTVSDKFSQIEIKRTIPVGSATFILGKQSVGIGTVPPANSKGLYLAPSQINGYDFVTLIELYTAPGELNQGDYIGVVKRLWSSVPVGVSIAHLYASTQGVGIIHKYKDGNYGSVLIFGYHNTPIKSFRLNNGLWEQTT